ncbi:MAG: DUF4442 domain-containing protein [Sediminibacterium sp.]
MNPNFIDFKKTIANSWKFRFFMLLKLPAALFSGLSIKELVTEKSVITVPFKWFNKNPFKSMYFATQSMAAEMSTGLLAIGQIYKRKPVVSMLVVGMEAKFHKKATDRTVFTCNDGAAIANAVEQAVITGEGQTLVCYSVGKNQAGETVSEFWFTWSFKSKKK